ncbi:hypothetical protein MAPG_03567, partial [Magnaporthiopsis poae ATCC 64411]|uniref:Uncharacterized protein n=1 Tax=Magnaporthiopsis poae (strain ATCC 64411 / 73-15) TaxID=644358 RepID=A0A0C4DUC7_MAGP6
PVPVPVPTRPTTASPSPSEARRGGGNSAHHTARSITISISRDETSINGGTMAPSKPRQPASRKRGCWCHWNTCKRQADCNTQTPQLRATFMKFDVFQCLPACSPTPDTALSGLCYASFSKIITSSGTDDGHRVLSVYTSVPKLPTSNKNRKLNYYTALKLHKQTWNRVVELPPSILHAHPRQSSDKNVRSVLADLRSPKLK